ncbi:MAG: acyl-CoA synthetase FdrA, partial [Candidatus Baldrarchaeia archaeon]
MKNGKSVVKILIKKNTYRDSVFLMRIRNRVHVEGIEDIALLIGTDANKRYLINAGLISTLDDVRTATANDLIIVVKGKSNKSVRTALQRCLKMLDQKIVTEEESPRTFARTLDSALRMLPEANLLFLSIPGPFVKREAMKALQNDLNLFIFSNNVPIDDEVELKKIAKEKGLLVMGPDCGTAIINGKCLGFANRVRRGPIGIVGASGTGIQEVSTQVHHFNSGISHAIGTGSNDTCDKVGGITTIEGLRRLERDEETKVIVLISKSAEPIAEKNIFDRVRECKKPVIINFLGEEKTKVNDVGAFYAKTLEEAALKAVKLC